VPEGDWFCKFCVGHLPALGSKKPLSAVYAWGDNQDGQLGIEETDEKIILEPIRVTALDSVSVRDIALGETFTILLTNEGDVYSVGTGVSGQLGHSDVIHEMLKKFRKV